MREKKNFVELFFIFEATDEHENTYKVAKIHRNHRRDEGNYPVQTSEFKLNRFADVIPVG